jgi:dolichol kinase
MWMGYGSGKDLVCLSGIACVGLGDAFASIVGSYLGRRHWPGSRRTLEGSLAMAVATGLPLAYLARGWTDRALLVVSSLAVAALEAYTHQMDNLFLPLFFMALHR